MRSNFYFLREDNKFDVSVFCLRNSSFKMLVVFSVIFEAGTKTILRYDFVAPLNLYMFSCIYIQSKTPVN